MLRVMSDLLVRLYDLPDLEPSRRRMRDAGIIVRRSMPYERTPVRRWIAERFSIDWADEFEATLGNPPAGTVLAIRGGELLGFACHDATARGFFGPTGVASEHRGSGIGHALLLEALHRMRLAGYGYAIIGGVGPEAFYRNAVDAMPIPDSQPGIYAHRLRGEPGTGETNPPTDA